MHQAYIVNMMAHACMPDVKMEILNNGKTVPEVTEVKKICCLTT